MSLVAYLLDVDPFGFVHLHKYIHINNITYMQRHLDMTKHCIGRRHIEERRKKNTKIHKSICLKSN